MVEIKTPGDTTQIRAEDAEELEVIKLTDQEIDVAQLRRMSKPGMTRWVKFSFGGTNIPYAMVIDAVHSHTRRANRGGAIRACPRTTALVLLGADCEVRARLRGSGANVATWVPFSLEPLAPSD